MDVDSYESESKVQEDQERELLTSLNLGKKSTLIQPTGKKRTSKIFTNTNKVRLYIYIYSII